MAGRFSSPSTIVANRPDRCAKARSMASWSAPASVDVPSQRRRSCRRATNEVIGTANRPRPPYTSLVIFCTSRFSRCRSVMTNVSHRTSSSRSNTPL